MTIISPRKEYWQSRGPNQRRPVLKSATLPTELWASATLDENHRERRTVLPLKALQLNPEFNRP